jgi:polar amino acid transport system permease protein
VFSLWGIAEMGDLVRGAVTSLPISQKQSAMALGLNNFQIYIYVIIPQAVRRLVPAAINLATRMIKTTPLVYMIGIIEVVKVGQQIIEASVLTNHLAPFWVYGFVFILYFLVCYPISLASKKLEEKWQS